MSYHEADNGEYGYQIHQDPDSCEIVLYRCGEEVGGAFFAGGTDAFLECMAIAKQWMNPQAAPH